MLKTSRRYYNAVQLSAERDDFEKFLKSAEITEIVFDDATPTKKRRIFSGLKDDYCYSEETNSLPKETRKEEYSTVVLRTPGYGGGKQRGIRRFKFDTEKEAYEVAKMYKKEWERLPYARVEYYPGSLLGFLHHEFGKKRPFSETGPQKNIEMCPCLRCYNSDVRNCYSHLN